MTVKTKRTPRPRKIGTWQQAAELTLHRSDPTSIYVGPIDRGVNFFVLMLEQLGATTEYSCEGHPNNFYIVFNAPYDLAVDIEALGFLAVEVEGPNKWSLRMRAVETDDERQIILKLAAVAWRSAFGPILYTPERQYAPLTRNTEDADRDAHGPHRGICSGSSGDRRVHKKRVRATGSRSRRA